MEKIIISSTVGDLLESGNPILVEGIVKEVGKTYILSDKDRQQTAVCVFIYQFPTWCKSVFSKA